MLLFRWKKTSDNRKRIVERHDIRSLRVKYLRDIRAYREEGRPVVYTDETYLHSSHTTPREWDDGTVAGLKAPISKGQRLIIVHAGKNTITYFEEKYTKFMVCKKNTIVINMFLSRWGARFYTQCTTNISVWYKEWRLPR